MTTQTNSTPLTWMPYEITAVEASPDTPRMGFIGRAAAMRIDGIECIVMCRHDHQLAAVGDELTGGNFDPTKIYKATLIESAGIDVIVPDAPTVEVPMKPVVPEVPVTPVRDVPLRGDDGLPVATYVSGADAQQDGIVMSEPVDLDPSQSTLDWLETRPVDDDEL